MRRKQLHSMERVAECVKPYSLQFAHNDSKLWKKHMDNSYPTQAKQILIMLSAFQGQMAEGGHPILCYETEWDTHMKKEKHFPGGMEKLILRISKLEIAHCQFLVENPAILSIIFFFQFLCLNLIHKIHAASYPQFQQNMPRKHVVTTFNIANVYSREI